MKKIIVIIMLLGLLSGCSTMAQRGAIRTAYEKYDKGDYQEALRKVIDAENYNNDAPPEMKAQILYLKSLIYQKMGNDQEATATLKFISDKYGDTEYGYKAKQLLKQ